MNRENTIRAHLGAQIMALDFAAAQDLMGRAYPVAVQPDAVAQVADLRIEPGQRYATLRGVAVMPIRGLLTPDNQAFENYLGWATYAGIVAASDELANSSDVAAVVLDVNCPGGMTRMLDSAVQALRWLAAQKPVYALVNPLAASAAYALIAGVSEIVMVPGAEVGSIGVMVESSSPVAPDLLGEQWAVLTSSHAAAKLPDVVTEAGRALWQIKLDELESRFHAQVAQGRGIPLAELPARLSVTDNPRDGGGIFGAEQAIAVGLADRVSTRAAFYEAIFAQYRVEAKPQTGGARASMRARAAVAVAKI